MKILYFAWLAERLETTEEHIALIDLPTASGQGLAEYLKNRYPQQSSVFDNIGGLRLAVNHTLVDWSHPLHDQDEVALFPPMTGG